MNSQPVSLTARLYRLSSPLAQFFLPVLFQATLLVRRILFNLIRTISKFGQLGHFQRYRPTESSKEETLRDLWYLNLLSRQASESQLGADHFALFIQTLSRQIVPTTFLEAGALDGVRLSNTKMLALHGWTGVLVEPTVDQFENCCSNRPESTVLNKVLSPDGNSLFLISFDNPEFNQSTSSSAHPDNSPVSGIRISDLLKSSFAEDGFSGDLFGFLSLDVEGGELSICEELFENSPILPAIAAVEHNFSSDQRRLDKLFESNGYQRLFRTESAHDAWYIHERVAHAVFHAI